MVRSIERVMPDRFGALMTVYENWLVTAGHCLGEKLVFRQRDAAYPVAGVIGFSAGAPRGHDVMVLAFHSSRPMPVLELAFGEYPKSGDKVMLIGYGRSALMMRVGPVIGYDERGHIIIENFACPGNSGGPVLIPGTRQVIGVGIETTLDVPSGVPVVFCGYAACGVKPPYYATHIDRVLGVASFR